MLSCTLIGVIVILGSFPCSAEEKSHYFVEDCKGKSSNEYLVCLVQTFDTRVNIALRDNPSVAKTIADTIRVILRSTRPFSDSVLDGVYTVFLGLPKTLPPIDNKLLLVPAIELAEKIRRREVTSEEIVRAYIDRSKLVNSTLNAVTGERYEDALREAQEVDRFLQNTNKTEEEIASDTPLLGLPFSCKEEVGIKGLPQTLGLVMLENRTAGFDGASAALYRKAGAIPIEVTNLPILAFWWETANKVFGMTDNPYDSRRTVGGSSGGEGSIISSAGSLFGIGTDLAGSIRIPSSFNGIYGHKPSRGIVSNEEDSPTPGPDPLDPYTSTGPMCRYAQDLPLLLKVLSDNDERIELDREVDFKNVTIYYMKEFPGYLQASVPYVKKAILKAANHFKNKFGQTPIKLHIKELLYAEDIFESKLLEATDERFSTALGGGEPLDLNVEFIKYLLGTSDYTLPAIYYGMIQRLNKDEFYYKYLDMFQAIQKRINETLEDKDAILLVPTHPEAAPHYLETIPKYPNIGYTSTFNGLGLPSTNVPAGLSPKGLPFGIQAVAGRFNDRFCLAAAIELDKVFGGWKSPGPDGV